MKRGTMMLGTTIVFAAALAAQSAGTLDKARGDYLKCMRGFLHESVKAKMPDAEFNMAVTTACQTDQTAFHAAVIALDRADGVKPADAKENADMQVADYVENFKEKFADHIESNTVPPKD
jgi:hypothetical protein